jgi:hypothetical protein
MADNAEEQADREEAERLRQLPRDEQAAAVQWHRNIADNRRLRKADRDAARARAEALARLLKLPKKRRPGP